MQLRHPNLERTALPPFLSRKSRLGGLRMRSSSSSWKVIPNSLTEMDEVYNIIYLIYFSFILKYSIKALFRTEVLDLGTKP